MTHIRPNYTAPLNDTRNMASVIVIGAGGMGMAVARRMASQYHIVLADIDGELAEEQAQQLRREGGRAVAVQCDVTSSTSVDKLRDVAASYGHFRSVIHVAGLSIAADDFAAILRVNLLGPALVTQSLLPLAQMGSSAVLISSMASHLTPVAPEVATILHDPMSPELVSRLVNELGEGNATPAAAYALSKWGVRALARDLVALWGQRGARIVSLSPGLIETPMGATAYAKSPNKQRMLARSPLDREGSVMEIADAVEFLVSDRASFISGTDILVDGGLSSVLLSAR